jgi:hypothetical protein
MPAIAFGIACDGTAVIADPDAARWSQHPRVIDHQPKGFVQRMPNESSRQADQKCE